MFYKVDFDIKDFKFWGGAKDRIESATDEQIKQVEQKILDCFCDMIPTDTEINDFVWFDCDDIFDDESDESDE